MNERTFSNQSINQRNAMQSHLFFCCIVYNRYHEFIVVFQILFGSISLDSLYHLLVGYTKLFIKQQRYHNCMLRMRMDDCPRAPVVEKYSIYDEVTIEWDTIFYSNLYLLLFGFLYRYLSRLPHIISVEE